MREDEADRINKMGGGKPKPRPKTYTYKCLRCNTNGMRMEGGKSLETAHPGPCSDGHALHQWVEVDVNGDPVL